jgi:dolichol-phosphate mannosyltransferase
MKQKIAVISPMYNEELSISKFLAETDSVLQNSQILDFYEPLIILINDGSTDSTVSIVENYQNLVTPLNLIHFTRNYGHQPAVWAVPVWNPGPWQAGLRDP